MGDRKEGAGMRAIQPKAVAKRKAIAAERKQEKADAERDAAAPLAPWLRGDRSGLPMKPPGKATPHV